MAKENKIVCIINDAIQQGFGTEALHGIVDLLYDDNVLKLAEYKTGAYSESVFIDNVFSIQGFHIHHRSDYEVEEKYSKLEQTQTATMSLIIMANRKKINQSKEDLETLIVSLFPDITSRKAELDLRYCAAKVTSVNHNANELFKQYMLESNRYQHLIMFEIMYQIRTRFTPECVNADCSN